MMKRLIATILSAMLVMTSFAHRPISLAGNWRGVFEIRPGVEVPFNFVIEPTADKKLKLSFLNAEEKFFAGILRQQGDSIFVPIDQFDNLFALQLSGGRLTGVLRKQDGTGTPTPLKATIGKKRFTETNDAPAVKLSGTFAINFTTSSGKSEKAVGLFTQDGKHLRATFLRITGDSRYLEGIVEGNTFYLSSFIGSSPAYYKGTVDSLGSITGAVIGAKAELPFTGTPDENAALPDPYKLTFLKDGYKTLDFTFPDLDGRNISLKDPKYQGKVVIITITGSWCPNCIDEAGFLAPWFKKNHSRGIEAIGIHYERNTDSAYLRKVITRFRNRFDVTYDQVIGGVADKQAVAASLPAINDFLSFPTTIIIDRHGKVAQIHTGFSGPATGKYFDEWVNDFNKEVDALLKE